MRRIALGLLLITGSVSLAQSNGSFNPAAVGGYQTTDSGTGRPELSPTAKATKVRQLQRQRELVLKRLADIDAELTSLGAEPAPPATSPTPTTLKDGGDLMLLTIAEVKTRFGLTAKMKAKEASAEYGIRETYAIEDPANHRTFIVTVWGSGQIHDFVEHKSD